MEPPTRRDLIQTFKHRERIYEMVRLDYERGEPVKPVRGTLDTRRLTGMRGRV